MSSPKRIVPHILCAIDFGEQGERAFFHALALAVAQNAHLTLLHIGPENRKEVPWEKYPGVRETLSRWRLLDDDASRADVSTQLGLSVKKMAMRDEDPYNGLLDYIRKHPTDLLVMATEARRGLSRLRRGSVAQAISHATNSRTLFLPASASSLVDAGSGLRKTGTALVVYDHEPDPRPALTWLGNWLPVFSEDEIDVHLLYVGEESEAPEVVLPKNSGINWQPAARRGPARETILDYAKECGAELIAMTNRQHRGLVGFITGSLSEQVLRRAGRPMLLLPETKSIHSGTSEYRES